MDDESTVINLIRYDGLFLIGEIPMNSLISSTLFNPAMVLHVPVQIQGRISTQAAIAYQTNIVFLDCAVLRLPASITPTLLEDNDGLAKHYRATLDLRKKGKQTIVVGPKH